MQLLFGYRYLLLAVLALLAFHVRLRRDDSRWMLLAGALAGLSLTFRLTPAFAVCVGIGFGVMLATRDWRRWIRDWSLFAAGLLVVLMPVLAWFANSVGVTQLVREVVVHPLLMLQPLPLPRLIVPESWTRFEVETAFWRLELRLYFLLFLGYLAALGWAWARCFRAGRRFPHAFLSSVVVFGAVFFIRSLGRADESHLDSTIPVVCVLIAHATSVVFERVRSRPGLAFLDSPWAATGLAATVLASWIFLLGSDRILLHATEGKIPIGGLSEEILVDPFQAKFTTRVLATIAAESRPDDIILDLSPSPYFYVLSGRRGPGTRDTIMPGTFYDEEDERAFLEILEANPPTLVLWPRRMFDNMPERSVEAVAPQVVEWVRQRYQAILRTQFFIVLAAANAPP